MDTALFMAAAESAKPAIDRVEREIHDKQTELKLRKRMASALRGLRTCWSDGYAGKYGPHWFFVREFSCTLHEKSGRKHIDYKKFWVTDIVSDPVKFRELAADGKVAYGTFADAKQAPCSCGRHVPVIGRYEQTEDSTDGDTWEMELYTFCLHCSSLASLGNDFKASYYY
ncbi:MAG TPA: hypothetical protein VL500_07970 [Candidatus Eisenbacteria bacterium]|jgi:hypothetical protein|nr:hypothetical protein [Candidatus Eisenbacteria bacterium]